MLYGLLWAIGALLGSTLCMTAVMRVTTASASPLVAFGVSFIMAWVFFMMWAKYRLRPAERLFTEGRICDGTVISVTSGSGRMGGYTGFEIAFSCEGIALLASGSVFHGRGFPSGLLVGAPAPVLYLPREERCAAFPVDAAMVSAGARPADA